MFRPTLLSSWLLIGVSALAQVPLPAQPSLPGRDMSLPSATMENNEMVRGLEFPNADVKDVLGLYETLTGKHLIYDVAVAGPINIIVKGDIPKDEAIRIIEMSLLLNGFSLVPAGGDLIKVLGLGKNPRGFGIPIVSDELQLPESEQVVTFVYKLHYADPTEVQQILSQYIVPSTGAAYNQLLALPKSQSLLITENTTIIRGLLKVIREIDLPPVEVVSEFIALQRADAKTVTENINKILNPSQQGAGGAPGAGAARTVAAGAGRPPQPRVTPEGNPIPGDIVASTAVNGAVEITSTTTLTEDAVIKAVLTPDERTNRIHVVARPANLRFIRKLIEEFDQDVPFGIPATRALRFRPADEVLPVIVKAITDPGTKSDDAGGAAGGNSSTGNRQGNNGLGSSQRGGGGNDILGGGQNGSSSSVTSNVNDSLETQPRETKPVAVVLGSTKLIADNATNSIIVIGNQEVKAKVFKLIDELDVRPPQVMLHTIIGELTLGETEQFGVDYILRKGGNFTTNGIATGNGTGNGTGTGNGNTSTGTATGIVGFTGNQPNINLNGLINQRLITQIATAGSTGLSGFFTAGNTLDGIVTALESTRKFRVTSRPSIYAQNNQVASIISGQEIAIPGNIQSSLNSFNQSSGIVTNSTVQYKTVALKLEILPLINSEREVSLDIVQRVDEVSGSTRIDQNDIPTVSTRAIKTHVSVPNQSTLVLGGLIRQSQTNSRGGIPVLSKIPLIGPLFRTTTKDKARTELVILIRPEVTVTPCEAVDTRERQMEYLNVDPDLETTLAPPNTRKRAPTDELLRRSQLQLRQEPVCVEEKVIEGFKK